MIKTIFFSFLFLIFFNSISYPDEIETLFLKLKKAENFSEAKSLENKIWHIWTTSGSNKENNLEMTKGIIFLKKGKLNESLQIFLNLSKLEPEWAEPLNKIATIKFLQKDYFTSMRYIKLTLEKERRHFGAISGLAQINLRLGRFENALKNINQALKIHPYLGINKIKPFLLEQLKKKEINFHLNYFN